MKKDGFDSTQLYSSLLVLLVTGIYLATLSPVVYLGDSGELTAAAYSLGIPHNSGYPLYAIIGKLFCLIPLGNMGFRTNLMSTVFSVLTVWMVYTIIFRMTRSVLPSTVGALFLAFTPVFWSQSVAAEVYPLHTFFVALIFQLLLSWDEKREFYILVLMGFITGLSFANHLQTVMLAPAVLFIVLSGDHRALFRLKYFLILFAFFIFPLTLYIYLPIRTEMGAAIHWGDPNTLSRFLAHVTAQSHREGYVLNRTMWDFFIRTGESFQFLLTQFGIVLVFALWGWIKTTSKRWRIFFVTVLFFDLLYTVFLNTISLEITQFMLTSCMVVSILSGLGIYHTLKKLEYTQSIGSGVRRAIQTTLVGAPLIPLIFHYGLCDQSRNYMAYEHAVNILRTVEDGSILILDGDNNVFPVAYGRIAERMREDVTLYDRHNIIFKMPYLGKKRSYLYGKWEEVRTVLEKEIIHKKISKGIYYAVFNPFVFTVPLPYARRHQGILVKVVEAENKLPDKPHTNPWKYYFEDSFYEDFNRDYMGRQVAAFYFFSKAQYFFSLGQRELGLKYIRMASQTGYNDELIHSELAVYLIANRYFKEARQELLKAEEYSRDTGSVYNDWGYYYYEIGELGEALTYFRKAVETDPTRFSYHSNYGAALFKAGKRSAAVSAFRRSLDLKKDQPDLRKLLEKEGLLPDIKRGKQP
jgi:tetratricopeptide (TPR) repeat protein